MDEKHRKMMEETERNLKKARESLPFTYFLIGVATGITFAHMLFLIVGRI